MKNRRFMTLLAGALLLVLAATPASADHATTYQADLQPLNDSGVTATADLSLADRELEITINAEGLAPGQPHAQHIHGVVGETSACPGPDADQDGDGLVSTAEGVPSYGGVLQSLTTEGDTSGDSALAVDRFPVAGDTVTFEVDHLEQHAKDEFPTSAVYGYTLDPTLRLVTCGGQFDRSLRSYTDNIVVFADLADS